MENKDSDLYYAVVMNKVENRELTDEIIQHHARHLAELDEEGKLVLAGPFTDHPSSLIVLKTKSKSEAIKIADVDPLIREGVRTFEVRTWLIANRENNFLPQI
jgi:uncharacterized protein YciI